MRRQLVLFMVIMIAVSVGFNTPIHLGEATPAEDSTPSKVVPVPVQHSPSYDGVPGMGDPFAPTSSQTQSLGSPQPPMPNDPPGPEDRAEYMIGTVAVITIFPESDGTIDPNTESWTQMRMDKVHDEIYIGLDWWESQMPNGRLEFTVYTYGQQTTSYEPISRASSDQYRWVGEILNGLGYASGDYIQDVMDLNNDVRNTNGKDWAFTAFIVDSLMDSDGTFDDGVFGYAFGMGGPFMVMTYDNDGWGINNMDKVMAHETGHMFYATDEYTRPGEWSGYLNVLEVDGSGCIMDASAWCVSSGTKGQLGWRDSDYDGVMDPEDTIPNSILDPQTLNPTTDNVLTYTGTAEEIALPNQNPFYNSWLNGHRVNAGNDVSINEITLVQYRIDGGVWLPTIASDGAFDEAVETFTFTTATLSDGTHTIETRARNTVGNWENTYSSDVVVVDTTPPTTSDIVDGTPGSSGWYLSDVTVTLMSSDSTTGVQYTKYKLNGGAWQDYLGPFVVNGDGIFNLEYYSVDNVDNVEPANQISLKIDTANPSTFDSQSGTMGANGYYTSQVMITLTASDTMSGIKQTRYNVNGGPYTSYIGPFVLTDDITHTVTFYSQDVAGNTESMQSLQVKIDATAPDTGHSISGTSGKNNWYLGSVTITLTPSDSGSGIQSTRYRIDGGSWLDYIGSFQITGDGLHDFEFYSDDYAGNVEATKNIQVKIDSEAPSTISVVDGNLGSNGWYRSDVTVDPNGSDAVSGVECTALRLDGGTWQTCSGSLLVTGEGTHTIEFYSVDYAGNTETSQSIQIGIDTELPQTSELVSGDMGQNGWYLSDLTINLTGSDRTSGVQETLYRLDGGTWQSYTSSILVNDDGTHVVEFYSEDYAGNEEEIKSIQMKIDATAPHTSRAVSGNLGQSGWFTGDVTIALSSLDNTSGVEYTQYRIDGSAWQDFTADILVASDGGHTLVYRSVDVAGNIEDAGTLEIKIDKTAPSIDTLTLSGTDDEGVLASSTTTTIWTGSDQASGIDHYEVRLDSGEYVQVSLTTTHMFNGIDDGSHSITVKAVDKAGNIRESTIHFVKETGATNTAGSAGEILLVMFILIVAIVVVLAAMVWKRRKKGEPGQR